MMQPIQGRVVHGLLEDRRRHTLAELRDPTGHDEAMLAELRRDATPAECISGLIAALTLRIGEIECPSIDRIRKLSAGDRRAPRARALRAASGTRGRPRGSLSSCGAVAEMPVRFADVAGARARSGVAAESQIELAAGDARWVARLRPPAEPTSTAARGTDLRPRATLSSAVSRRSPIDPVTVLRRAACPRM